MRQSKLFRTLGTLGPSTVTLQPIPDAWSADTLSKYKNYHKFTNELTAEIKLTVSELESWKLLFLNNLREMPLLLDSGVQQLQAIQGEFKTYEDEWEILKDQIKAREMKSNENERKRIGDLEEILKQFLDRIDKLPQKGEVTLPKYKKYRKSLTAEIELTVSELESWTEVLNRR